MTGQPVKMFMHRLALELGCTVTELEDTMPYRELLDWMDFAQFHPFGEDRADMRNALLTWAVCNVAYQFNGKQAPFTPQNFMLFREREEAVVNAVIEEVKERKGATISEDLLTQLFLVSARPKKGEVH